MIDTEKYNCNIRFLRKQCTFKPKMSCQNDSFYLLIDTCSNKYLFSLHRNKMLDLLHLGDMQLAIINLIIIEIIWKGYAIDSLMCENTDKNMNIWINYST